MRLPKALVRPAILAAALMTGSCGGGGNTDWAEATIGPDGGTVEVTDTSSPLHGLKIEVPAGALSEPTIIKITEVGGTPDLADPPPGFAAFNPMVHLSAGASFAAKVKVSFPMEGIPSERDRILSAFYYDDAQGAWSMVLPKAAAEGVVTFETTHFSYWRWGISFLEDTSGATLEPAMRDLYGEEQWNAIKAKIEEEFDITVAPKLTDVSTWDNCDSLNVAWDFFQSIADSAAADAQAALAVSCGGCDVTVDVFMGELREYIQARVRNWMTDLIIEQCDLPFVLDLYLKLGASVYFDKVIRDLSCDYECLIDNPPPGFYADLVTYYLSNIGMGFIYIGFMYDGCI